MTRSITILLLVTLLSVTFAAPHPLSRQNSASSGTQTSGSGASGNNAVAVSADTQSGSGAAAGEDNAAVIAGPGFASGVANTNPTPSPLATPSPSVSSSVSPTPSASPSSSSSVSSTSSPSASASPSKTEEDDSEQATVTAGTADGNSATATGTNVVSAASNGDSGAASAAGENAASAFAGPCQAGGFAFGNGQFPFNFGPFAGLFGSPSTNCSLQPTKSPSPSPVVESSSPSPVPPVPDVVELNEPVQIPPSTQLSDPTTYSFTVEVRPGSGSTLEDLYLLTDLTGSTTKINSEIRENFAQIVNERSRVSSNVAFGVGAYTDETIDPFFENRQRISTDISAVQQAIEALDPNSFPHDAPEANLAALYTVATSDEIGWRTGSRRIVVLFGDAPGHEPSCIFSLQLRRDNVIAVLNKKSITVVAFSFVGSTKGSPGLNAPTKFFGPGSQCEAAEPAPTDVGQADAITAGTGGSVVEQEELTQVIENTLAEVNSLPQTLEADTSDCEAQNVAISFSPGLPLTISSGSSQTISQSVEITACGDAKGAFTCTVRFSLSGTTIGEHTLSSSGLDVC